LAIEAARAEVWPLARPVDDFFHFREKHRAIEARLRKVVSTSSGVLRKEFLGWVTAALEATRSAPTAQTFHLIWNGLLSRLRHEGETVVADYLQKTYTREVAAPSLHDNWSIMVNEPHAEEPLSFAGTGAAPSGSSLA
jgi:hypothetical protein